MSPREGGEGGALVKKNTKDEYSEADGFDDSDELEEEETVIAEKLTPEIGDVDDEVIGVKVDESEVKELEEKEVEIGDDDWSENKERDGWVIIGWAQDKITANFVVETLKSYDMTAVLESKSGFLGDVGLALNPAFEDIGGAYEIWVQYDNAEEAQGLAEMVAGDKWESADVE